MLNDRDRGDGASLDLAHVEIITVPTTGKAVVRFLGAVMGIWTHWKGNRSYACTGPDKCEPSLHRQRTVWKGYAACELLVMSRPRTWRPGVLELTEALAEYIDQENPRGQVWTLERFRINQTRAECRGTLLRTDDPATLRSDVEVENAVRRLYRCLFIQFGMEAPLGRRQRLAPIPVDHVLPGSAARESPQDDPVERAKIRKLLDAALQGHALPNGRDH